MKIEELVPTLELCKRIPEGEFEDSCFVRIGEDTIILRSNVCGVSGRQYDIYPAPTLQEIMEALPADTLCGKDHHADWFISNWQIACIDDTERKGATTVALRLWLTMKGVEA